MEKSLPIWKKIPILNFFLWIFHWKIIQFGNKEKLLLETSFPKKKKKAVSTPSEEVVSSQLNQAYSPHLFVLFPQTESYLIIFLFNSFRVLLFHPMPLPSVIFETPPNLVSPVNAIKLLVMPSLKYLFNEGARQDQISCWLLRNLSLPDHLFWHNTLLSVSSTGWWLPWAFDPNQSKLVLE